MRILVRQYKLRADGSRIYQDIALPIGKKKSKERGTIRLKPGGETIFEVNNNNGIPVVPASDMNQEGMSEKERLIEGNEIKNSEIPGNDINPRLRQCPE